MNEQEKVEAYLSSVRHDMRGKLMVVREGASMILDGIGQAKCDNCFALLRPVVECADQLNKLVGELLSASRFEALLVPRAPAKEEELRTGKKDLFENELERFKYKLMGMISHIIRTPLAVVKESLALVLDEIPGKLNAKQRELLSTGKQSVDELIQSVEETFEKSWNEIASPGRSSSPSEAAVEKERVTPKKKILIIEDQAVIVNILRMRLEANHYEVITAGDGQEGFEKARQENPDLIILDVMLPKMNGYKVCQLLKADPKYRTIPVIISSGRTPQEIRKVSKEVGADAYIHKPFEAEVLLSKMKGLLEAKRK
jgi:CheY-like chemotaxis protein